MFCVENRPMPFYSNGSNKRGQVMKVTRKVKEILSWYESENPG